MIKNVTQEEARKFCESLGYEVININNYKNVDTVLYLKDKDGYIYQSRYRNLKNNHEPHKFYKTNPYTIQNIKLWLQLNNKNLELINEEYTGNQDRLFCKDVSGYIVVTNLTRLIQNCSPYIFHVSNPYTIQNIKLWMKTNAKGYELLSTEYIGNHDKLLFKCPEGHKFEMVWSNFKTGCRCPYCSNHKVLKGYNDIATTNPWMIDLGMSREDAEKYMRSSGKKVTVTCPHCGKEKEMSVSTIYTYKSIQCTCGDGISYSEKFIISMLNQLNIRYIREYHPKWSNSKRYDFYLEDYNCIIECHGGQHYNESGFKLYGGKTLQEEQKNDKYKKQLALENSIDSYIELDCSKSKLEYIKQSILNSKISEMFDLNKIEWLQCEEYALSNRVKEICNYWREYNNIQHKNLTTTNVGEIFNLTRHTVSKYLKQGAKLGWCNYDPKEEFNKNNEKTGLKNKKFKSKPVEIFKDGKSLGIFESTCELERQSEKLFGVKLLNSNISQVCNGKKSQYKGFTFKYIK